MIQVFIALLNMSIAASIVGAVVMFVRFPLKKAPKIFSYALWGIVFLRLICPVSFESSTSLMPTNTEIIPMNIINAEKPQINSGIPVIDGSVNLLIENVIPQAGPSSSDNLLQVVLSIGAYIWLCGLVILMLYAIWGFIGMKRKVYDATLLYENIFQTDKIPTAFVLGFIHPKIYIPTAVKGAQLNYILEHEQVHIRRRDYLIKPLAFFILATHWFNPVIWVSYYLMSKDMEMSCDEVVLRKSSEDIRQTYSAVLVNLYARKPGLLSPLAFGEGSFRNMKARVKNVLNFKKAPRWAIILCSFLLVLFTAGFTTNPPQNLVVDNIQDTASPPADQSKTDNNNFNSSATPEDGHLTYADYYNSEEYQQQWESYNLSKESENYKATYELYEPYGITYDTTSNRLYHNDKLVRYFEDIWGNPFYHGVFRFFGPFTDGELIITAQRGATGELVGLNAEKYDANKDYEWEINPPELSGGDAGEIAGQISLEIREALHNAYQEYDSYGLRYDVQAGRLYHNNNLVRYFEDKTMGRYFGAYEDGEYNVYAVRNADSLLTGFEVLNWEDDVFDIKYREYADFGLKFQKTDSNGLELHGKPISSFSDVAAGIGITRKNGGDGVEYEAIRDTSDPGPTGAGKLIDIKPISLD